MSAPGSWSVLVRDDEVLGPVEVAETFAARSRGLLGRDGLDGALWIAPASQVHTLRMRFALDVAFLDRGGTVLRTATLAPNRLSRPVWRAKAVVEAQAGAFTGWGLRPGDHLEVRPQNQGPSGATTTSRV